jgi:hypothetical protein
VGSEGTKLSGGSVRQVVRTGWQGVPQGEWDERYGGDGGHSGGHVKRTKYKVRVRVGREAGRRDEGVCGRANYEASSVGWVTGPGLP